MLDRDKYLEGGYFDQVLHDALGDHAARDAIRKVHFKGTGGNSEELFATVIPSLTLEADGVRTQQHRVD